MRRDTVKAAVCGTMFAVGIASCLVAPQCAQAADWSDWSAVKQASCYGGADEPWETTTATGKHITSSTKYVAVPMNRVVSKKTWGKLSKSQKYRFFYYGERVQLLRKCKCKTKTHKLTVRIEDCGGFSGCGGKYKGKWTERLFDLTPCVYGKLHVDGLGWVKFRYEVR